MVSVRAADLYLVVSATRGKQARAVKVQGIDGLFVVPDDLQDLELHSPLASRGLGLHPMSLN